MSINWGRAQHWYVVRLSSLKNKHAIPMGNPHIGVLVAMSAYMKPEKLFTLVVQGIINISL
jgi:hypothetical protein